MTEEKVEAMKAKTKTLLQTKHDEMKAILKSQKQQHMEKMQQLKAESDERLNELSDLHRLQVTITYWCEHANPTRLGWK